jgi:hypothetical protein
MLFDKFVEEEEEEEDCSEGTVLFVASLFSEAKEVADLGVEREDGLILSMWDAVVDCGCSDGDDNVNISCSFSERVSVVVVVVVVVVADGSILRRFAGNSSSLLLSTTSKGCCFVSLALNEVVGG